VENAHLRMGVLEFERHSEKISTRVRVRVSHYIGEAEEGHLLSVFGNDSDVGAITAAVHEQAHFRLTFPDGREQEMSFGERAACYRGSISMPGRKQPVRHMIALSEEIRGLGSMSRTYVLRFDPVDAWTAMVQRLGLPAVPEWAEYMMEILKKNDRIKELDSIGCLPMVVSAGTEEVLQWMEAGVVAGDLRFPEKNGPIRWPCVPLSEVLRPSIDTSEEAA
jgi:hypothetical protein